MHVTRELDLCSAPTLAQALRHPDGWRVIVLDLRQLSFLDASGVHVILEAAARARAADCRLLLIRGPAQVDRILSRSGAADALDIVDPGRELPDWSTG
jgi:anti-anti-sigma factor